MYILFYLEICPEHNPKWGGLTEILKEIEQNSKDNGEIVLVLVQSAKTCCQLKNVIALMYILIFNIMHNKNILYLK